MVFSTGMLHQHPGLYKKQQSLPSIHHNYWAVSNRLMHPHVAFGAACALASEEKKHLFLAGQSARKPVQAFIKTVTRGGTRRLDEPLPVLQIVQAQFFSHLGRSHRIWQILLVGENQENCITHLILVQHLGQLLSGILSAVTIITVDHVDDAVGACVIVTPQWANPVLAADIPM